MDKTFSNRDVFHAAMRFSFWSYYNNSPIYAYTVNIDTLGLLLWLFFKVYYKQKLHSGV